jgi:hypothetical protein
MFISLKKNELEKKVCKFLFLDVLNTFYFGSFQTQFVERIRQVIQQQKSEQKGRQIQLQQQQQMQQQLPGAVSTAGRNKLTDLF